MRHLLLLTLLSLGLSSCFQAYKKVDLKIKNNEPQKLVVVSFISPQDSILVVYVSRSLSATIHANFPQTVSDATVSISDGNQTVFFDKMEPNGLYYSQRDKTYYGYKLGGTFQIVAGNSYTLHVETPHGEVSTAKCTVPALQNTSFEVTKEETKNGNTVYDIQYKCQWKDLFSDLTYYTVSAFHERYDSTIRPNYNKVWGLEPEFDTTVITNLYDFYFSNSSSNASIYYSNESQKAFSVIAKPSYYGSMEPTVYYGNQFFWSDRYYYDRIEKTGSRGAKFYLSTTDEHYYKYFTSLKNYAGEDFFSEPSKLYSNIENGYGVFAAKNSFELVIK